jgi:hypothetical protein
MAAGFLSAERGDEDALERYAAPHRVDDRRFHGQVNVAIVERQLWDRCEGEAAEAVQPGCPGH